MRLTIAGKVTIRPPPITIAGKVRPPPMRLTIAGKVTIRSQETYYCKKGYY